MQLLILEIEMTADVKGEASCFSVPREDGPPLFSSSPTSLLLQGAKIHSKVNAMSLFF